MKSTLLSCDICLWCLWCCYLSASAFLISGVITLLYALRRPEGKPVFSEQFQTTRPYSLKTHHNSSSKSLSNIGLHSVGFRYYETLVLEQSSLFSSSVISSHSFTVLSAYNTYLSTEVTFKSSLE